MLDIVTYGDPVLEKKAEAVTEFDERLVKLVDEMFAAMEADKGVGLAAPQVGRSLRIFVTKVEDDRKRVFVNPEIVATSLELVEYEEGCLSVPGLSWEITRPNAIHLVGYDLEGNEISVETDEFEGRIFQHEMDHLNGVLLIERLDEGNVGALGQKGPAP